MIRARLYAARRFAITGGTAGLLAVSLGAAALQASPASAATGNAASSGATPQSPASPAAGIIRPGQWAQVTTPLKGTAIIPQIGLARGRDGVLHVVWLNGASPTFAIKDTPITAGGRVGKPVTVASHWFLATDPDATVTPDGVVALWNGIKTESGDESGTATATRPLSGGPWKVSPTIIKAPTAAPDTGSPDTAATGSDGKPWIGFTGTDSLVVGHFGHPDVQLNPGKFACCVLDVGLATDGKSGVTSLTYDSEITNHQGVFARPLAASGKAAGPARLLPGSVENKSSIVPEQKVGITGRGHGRAGTYVIYGAGWPTYHSFNVIKLGSRKVIKVARPSSASDELAGADIAADASGRLWVAWIEGDGGKPALFVRRSNPSAGTFGATERVALPKGTTTVFQVYINAVGGKADVVALVARNNNENQADYWATEVNPKLSLSASRSSHGGAKVTLRVTDAGSSVRGATVRFCGHRASTGKTGRVTFRVHSISHGSATASAAKGGFAGTSVRVKASC